MSPWFQIQRPGRCVGHMSVIGKRHPPEKSWCFLCVSRSKQMAFVPVPAQLYKIRIETDPDQEIWHNKLQEPFGLR